MSRSRHEEYVRPPLVPHEPPSPTLAAWRFRVVATVLLIVLALVVVALFLQFSGVTAEDPGLPVGLTAPAASLTAPAARLTAPAAPLTAPAAP